MAKLNELYKQLLSLQISIRSDEQGGKTYGYYLSSGFIACDSLHDLKQTIAAEIDNLEELYEKACTDE